MPTNPYSSELSRLPQLRAGSEKALDVIYRAMRKNLTSFGKRLDTENLGARRSIESNTQAVLDSLGLNRREGISSALSTAGVGGEVDTAQAKLLSSLASDDVDEYQGVAKARQGLERGYQTRLRGLDKQYVKDLQASAVREKQARQVELEQGIVEAASGLRLNEGLFGAQQAQLGFQQGQLGTYSVGAATGLSAAEAYIIQRESGGDPNARNGSSGAFGLGQLNPSSGTLQEIAGEFGFNPYTTDVQQQLMMFRRYVQKRYGTAEAAMAFWQKNHWY